MTQKKIFGMVIGGVLVVSAFALVYQQFSRKIDERAVTQSNNPSSQKKASVTDSTAGSVDSVMVPLPDTIDGIAGSIEAESLTDLSAMDAEESGTLDTVNQDSASVNNLSTSYDENNL